MPFVPNHNSQSVDTISKMLRHFKDYFEGKLQKHADLSSTQGSSISSGAVTHNHNFNPLQVGLKLSTSSFNTFYSQNQFCTPFNERDTIDKQHGYLVWPVSIEVWSLANATLRSSASEKTSAASKLRKGFEAMNLHWSLEYKGYCAWHNFPGNRDVYYDDNAHCGNALVYAFEATGDATYLDRAREIVMGILTRGWDQGEPGGMPWHIDQNKSRNSCSTLSTAMLCARLALHNVPEREYCMRMAKGCIEFSEKHLIADDGLALDNYHLDGDGKWSHDHRKFTYNTGFGIEAFFFWSKASGDMSYMQKATQLALKSIDPSCVLFDQTFQGPDIEKRIWRDSTFFAHHLVEALALVAKFHGAKSDISIRITRYLERLALWCHTWVFDEADGMYFRNLRPYFIDEERTKRFNETFGTNHTLSWQADEHEQDGDKKLIKTMMGQASMVNIMLYVSDLLPIISFRDGVE